MEWTDVLTWVLQALAACGAIWGLYSKETSEPVEGTSKRQLTGRGRLALIAVILGSVAFGANQWQDRKKAGAAEANRKEEAARADRAEKALTDLQASQHVLRTEQTKQLELLHKQTEVQSSQIQFLRHLALVQQELGGFELSWPATATMRQRIERRVRATPIENAPRPSGQDVYFEPCILFGEIVLTRRPNYTWRLDCRLARPQGMLSLAFDVSLADHKALLIDSFLDGLLSPNFVLQNQTGDVLSSFTTASRPSRIERRDSRFVIAHQSPGTRMSALERTDIIIRMDVRETVGLPEQIRLRSLDPLASFDVRWRPKWQMRVVETIRTQLDVADEPIEVPVHAAMSIPQRLPVAFTRLVPTEFSADVSRPPVAPDASQSLRR